MKLYSYQYLTHNSNQLNDMLMILGVIIGIAILIVALKYSKDRTNLKFRNMLIVAFAVAAMLICLAIGKFQSQETTQNSSNQIARIMKKVAHEDHLSVKQMYASSPSSSTNIVLKAKNKYYQVNIDSATSVYSIKKVHPITNQYKYVHGGGLDLNFSNGLYLNIACKLLIGFVMLIMQINLAGKSNIDPSNPIDELQNYVLGGIVGGTVFNLSISLLQFVGIILIWTIIIFGSKVLINQSDTFKRLVDGNPKVLIRKGQIDVDAALKGGISADALVFKLNNSGVHDLNSVSQVTLEINGELRIDNYNSDNSLPVITDGGINSDMLEHLNKDADWLKDLLKQQNHSVKDVYLGQIQNGNQLVLTLYPKHDSRLIHFSPNQKIKIKKMLKGEK